MIDQRTRVLLVDDEEDEFVLARNLLHGAATPGFALEWAPSFEAGLQMLRDDAPSVCLVDYRLGSRSGVDFLREARTTAPDLPLILMTGRGDRAVDAEAAEAGADDYLDKLELTAASLERSIRHALQRAAKVRGLHQSDDLHRSIIAAMSEALIVLSADGRVVAANPAAGRILQVQAAALVGRVASEEPWRWSDADGDPLVGVDHPLRPGKAWSEPSRILSLAHADGSVRWLAMNGAPIRELGRSATFVVSFEDVTDARDAARRLSQVERVDALDRLAGHVAHDFNNLLMVIRACVESLQMPAIEVSESDEILATLSSTTDRATELTRSLLDLRSRSSVEVRILDPLPLIEGLRTTFQGLLGDEIELVIDGPSRSALVRVDPTRLEQALLNLIVNARDAMPDGGHLAIVLDGDAAGTDKVSISVRDDGQGMDAATRARAFEPYFSTKGRGRGTGLGLASVYGMVSDSGGDIRIESVLGVGTTVCIWLPRIEAATPAA